jgi:hypothetical protein
MVACQFQIPTYDYDKSIDPHIRKCDLCYDRRKTGQLPACVDICPNEALVFGKRSDVLKIAKDRIRRKPDVYVKHIYGEYEIGGTSWMYIAGKNFDELKCPPLDPNRPGISESIQHGILLLYSACYFIRFVGLIMGNKAGQKHGTDETNRPLSKRKEKCMKPASQNQIFTPEFCLILIALNGLVLAIRFIWGIEHYKLDNYTPWVYGLC